MPEFDTPVSINHLILSNFLKALKFHNIFMPPLVNTKLIPPRVSMNERNFQTCCPLNVIAICSFHRRYVELDCEIYLALISHQFPLLWELFC